jgi:hypothetical protein
MGVLLRNGGREGIRTPGRLIANSGENKLRQGATITLAIFTGPLIGKSGKGVFLFVFSVQFDGENRDKNHARCLCL